MQGLAPRSDEDAVDRMAAVIGAVRDAHSAAVLHLGARFARDVWKRAARAGLAARPVDGTRAWTRFCWASTTDMPRSGTRRVASHCRASWQRR